MHASTAADSVFLLMIKFGKLRKTGVYQTGVSGFDSFRAKLRNELNLKI
jgi:hypothetical protein